MPIRYNKVWIGIATRQVEKPCFTSTHILIRVYLKEICMGKICGIYCIKNKINGKCYVGQSVDIDNRWKGHKKLHSKNSTYLYNSLKKYSADGFDWVVLEECPKEQLNSRESHWIEKLNTMSPNGYNLTSGGGQGYIFSDEVRNRMSEIKQGEKNNRYGAKHTGETIKRMSEAQIGCKNHQYGRIYTEEEKIAMSKSLMGRVFSDEHRSKIANSLTGKYREENSKINQARAQMKGKSIGCSNGSIYLSIYEAVSDTGSHASAICGVCNGRRKTTNNLTFWYNK